MEQIYFTRVEAARYLCNKGIKISPKTLAKYATVGGSPEFCKFGNSRVVYTQQALDKWITDNLSKPLKSTSEFSPPSKPGGAE